MKKQLLTSLILFSLILAVNAQIFTPAGTIQGSSGNNYVGVGTTNPYTSLSFGSSIGDKIALWEYSPSMKYGFGIKSNCLQIFSNASTDRVSIGYYNSGNPTENLTVTNGNVGIGTTNPANTLVLGNSVLSNPWSSAYKVLDMYGYGYIYGSSNGAGFSGSGYGQTAWGNNTYYTGIANAIGTGAASYLLQGTGYLIFANAPAVNAGSPQNFSERFRIDNSGNVGIGTSSPGIGVAMSGGLTINGSSSTMLTIQNNGTNAFALNAFSSGAWTMFDNASGSWKASITSKSGNVGIGTTNPAYTLDVNGIGRFGTSALIGTGVAAGYYQDISNGAYRSLNVSGSTGYYFQNYNGAATTMFVGLQGTYAGNVGIGTTSPITKLDVAGDITLGVDGSYNILRGRAAGAAIQFGTNSATWNRNLYLGFVDNTLAFSPLVSLIHQTGNVGIGTTTPDQLLTVKGIIHAQEVKVDVNFGADYVFDSNYKLRKLNDVEQFIKENKHLPDIAPAKTMQDSGVNVSEMQNKLLQKVEELTLYSIQQNKRIESIEEQNKLLQQEIELLKQK